MFTFEHGGDCGCACCQAHGLQTIDGGTRVLQQPFVFAPFPNWPAGQPITWANINDVGDINNPYSAGLSAAFLVDVRTAFATWASVANVSFQEISNYAEADIVLGFIETLPETWLAATVTFYTEVEPLLSAVAFLASANFVTQAGVSNGGAGTPYSFLAVALHEIGHALGLAHETTVPALMNPVYNPAILTLQADDIIGMVARYGPAPSTEGADLLVGRLDAGDSLFGVGGDDRLYGLSGNDTLDGGDGSDSLYGNLGNDSIRAGTGSDQGRGHLGNDSLIGDAGSDLLFGGGDDDRVEGGTESDVLNGNSGLDSVFGGVGNDTVRGQGGADRLFGGAGDDVVLGMQGFDTLDGGDDNDVLIGGEADDLLTGGNGVDAFVFAALQGSDTIVDFEDGTDVISLVGVPDFGALTVVDTPDGARITFEAVPTTAITLAGVAAARIDAADFFFTA